MRMSLEIRDFKDEPGFKIYRLFNEFDRQENSIMLVLNKKNKAEVEKLGINGLNLITIKLPNSAEEDYEIEYKRNSILEEIEKMSSSHTYVVLAQRNYNHNSVRNYLFVYYALNVSLNLTEQFNKNLLPAEKLEFNSSKNLTLLEKSNKLYLDIISVLESENIFIEKDFSYLRENCKSNQEESELNQEYIKSEYVEFELKPPYSSKVITNGNEFIIPKGSRLEIPASLELREKFTSLIENSLVKIDYRYPSLIRIKNQPFNKEDKATVLADFNEPNITSALILLIGKSPNKKYYEYFKEEEKIFNLLEFHDIKEL